MSLASNLDTGLVLKKSENITSKPIEGSSPVGRS